MVYDNSNTLVYIYIRNLNYYKIESITETKVEVSFKLMRNLIKSQMAELNGTLKNYYQLV
jgi:hypothetical protein